MEAMSDATIKVVGTSDQSCSFIVAATQAWSEHHPLKLKPEHIWLLILQSTAVHVDQNAEKLRQKFVNFEGKKELLLRRDEFVLGSTTNDWEGLVKEFVEQIDKA